MAATKWHLGIKTWSRQLAEVQTKQHGMVVGARWADLSMSETADLLGSSKVYKKWPEEKISSERLLCGPKWLVDVWIFSRQTLGPLIPIEHCLNAVAYLSIVADHVHPFITTVYTSSHGYFSRIMHHVTYHLKLAFSNMSMSSLYSNGLRHQISIQ